MVSEPLDVGHVIVPPIRLSITVCSPCGHFKYGIVYSSANVT